MAVSWLNSLTIVGVAKRLQAEIANSVILDQYRNVRDYYTDAAHLADTQKGK